MRAQHLTTLHPSLYLSSLLKNLILFVGILVHR